MNPLDASSDPYSGLDFIINLIESLFATNDRSLINILRRLAILEIRYEEAVINSVYIDWIEPLATDFSSLHNIRSLNLDQMAISITKTDRDCFNRLCAQDFLEDDSDLLGEIGKIWQRVSRD